MDMTEERVTRFEGINGNYSREMQRELCFGLFER
jgi:hypothetical protein